MAKTSTKKQAAKDILAAIKAGDAAALEKALCAFIELEDEEYDEDEE